MSPVATSADNGDMPVDEFRRYAHELVEWIADFLAKIDDIPVLPDISPGELRTQLPSTAPERGESMKTILEDVDRLILPAMTHWNHPNFHAYFSISGSGPGILGEFLAAAFNINAMLWKSCPAATELEQVVLDWLRQMLGLPASFKGVVYDTASVSTLHAVAAAREHLAHLQIRQKGMAGRPDIPRLRLYTSEQAHSSVDKAALTLGLGLEGIRKIPTDAAFRMKPEALEQAIAEDRRHGWLPFCVVATVGTTSTTSIDPIPDIADICERERLWLHVDAAYGGSAAVVPELRHILDGCDRADSIVVNPHKWLFVPIDFSAFYTRKHSVLKQAFSLVPEYLRTREDEIVENYMDYGIQLGRRFRALKLWFVLRYFGQEGIAERIRKHIQLAQLLADWIDGHPDFERMAPVPFSTVCFRAHPAGIDDDRVLNTLNQNLLDTINHTRRIFLSHTRLHEKFVLRFAIGNIRTGKQHIEKAWDIIQQAWKQVYKGSG